MYTEVNTTDFIDAFRRLRPENFTTAGLRAMYDYFGEYEDSTGDKIELDVIAICVDWSEYEDFAELQSDYNDIDDLDDLHEHTTVIEIPNSESLIVESF